MPSSFSNSPTKVGTVAARIESGVISDVNPRNMTVSWVSQYTGRQITDIQIMSPYFHYNNGEGFTCIPEIGAICVVCFPSDEDSPFIMGFLSAPEMEGAEVSKFLEDKLQDYEVETEEGIPVSKTTNSGGSTVSGDNPSDASYRGGRPILNPGDMYWQGRDENFVILRRGGILQIGATNICQRVYIPITNFIRDFCENYELNSASGTLSWDVQRQENNPSGNAATEFVLIARQFAQDKKASIRLSIGSLDNSEKPPNGDKTFVEIVIAPQAINSEDGQVSGSPKYVLRIDKAGNSYQLQAGTLTNEVEGDYKLSVTGSRDTSIGGDDTLIISGKSNTQITGNHILQGVSSKEMWDATKVITAAILRLGNESASEPAVLGVKLLSWLTSHTHPVVGALAGPPIQGPATVNLVSKTVFVNK